MGLARVSPFDVHTDMHKEKKERLNLEKSSSQVFSQGGNYGSKRSTRLDGQTPQK